MSKWRPNPTGCIYVIPDIHGQANELKLILNRILPLRNNKNAVDKLIFLGDYIDRGKDSPRVLDILIALRKTYQDQVVFLRGNHEWLMLASAGRESSWADPFRPTPYAIWVNNGGDKTIVQYAARKGVNIYDGMHLKKDRAVSFIEMKHLDFLQRETVLYYELDNYIFVHAGCDPTVPLEDQDEEILMWDRSVFDFVQKMVAQGQDLPWDKTVITGHSYKGPFINSKFMMLDSSFSRKLLTVELTSMEAFSVGYGKQRMVKEELKENLPFSLKTPVFRRVIE